MNECNHNNWKFRKKATDSAGWPDEWNHYQILECRDCGKVWME